MTVNAKVKRRMKDETKFCRRENGIRGQAWVQCMPCM